MEHIQGILNELEQAQHLVATEVTPETNLKELICKRYLLVGKVEDALKEVKGVGMKNYKSIHISDVIKGRKVEGLNLELYQAAKLLRKINKGKCRKAVYKC